MWVAMATALCLGWSRHRRPLGSLDPPCFLLHGTIGLLARLGVLLQIIDDEPVFIAHHLDHLHADRGLDRRRSRDGRAGVVAKRVNLVAKQHATDPADDGGRQKLVKQLGKEPGEKRKLPQHELCPPRAVQRSRRYHQPFGAEAGRKGGILSARVGIHANVMQRRVGRLTLGGPIGLFRPGH